LLRSGRNFRSSTRARYGVLLRTWQNGTFRQEILPRHSRMMWRGPPQGGLGTIIARALR
jgi:hypothetical protein